VVSIVETLPSLVDVDVDIGTVLRNIWIASCLCLCVVSIMGTPPSLIDASNGIAKSYFAAVWIAWRHSHCFQSTSRVKDNIAVSILVARRPSHFLSFQSAASAKYDMAVPLGEVPKDLICAVCIKIPPDMRVLKPCSHVFCKDCIYESLSHHESCPMCRCACTEEDVVALNDKNSALFRVWANLAVKCEHHAKGCCWTGSISDYESHTRSCPKKKKIQQIRCLKKENDFLKEENESLKALKEENESLKALKEENEYFKSENVYVKQCLQDIKTGFRHLTRKNRKLKTAQDDSNNHINKIMTFVQEVEVESDHSEPTHRYNTRHKNNCNT
jgi:hypothetical protein